MPIHRCRKNKEHNRHTGIHTYTQEDTRNTSVLRRFTLVTEERKDDYAHACSHAHTETQNRRHTHKHTFTCSHVHAHAQTWTHAECSVQNKDELWCNNKLKTLQITGHVMNIATPHCGQINSVAWVCPCKHRRTHTNTHRHTDLHKDTNTPLRHKSSPPFPSLLLLECAHVRLQ